MAIRKPMASCVERLSFSLSIDEAFAEKKAGVFSFLAKCKQKLFISCHRRVFIQDLVKNRQVNKDRNRIRVVNGSNGPIQNPSSNRFSRCWVQVKFSPHPR